MSFSRPRRAREDEDQDGARVGGEGPTPAKRPRGCSCSCCCSRQETKDFYESQIDILKKEMQCMSKGFIEESKTFQREMQSFYQNSQLQLSEQSRRMEQLIREQFNTLIAEISTARDHVRKNSDSRASCHQRKIRTHRLKFENKCCDDKYSGHAIKADDGNPIKVAIHGGNDNRIITNGPLSSMQVKIVVLDGEFNKQNKEQWSGDSFLQNIVHGRPGKPPLFANELYIRLENGVANLCGVKFQDNVPSKKFRLGVMAADDSISENILEGISEPFTIKAGRGFPIKKHSSPSLRDPIYKLKKIAENGVRKKKLEQKHINLVQDFLLSYNKDKNSLREACGNISDHDWEVLVEHALSCKPGDVVYSYCIPEMDATIFFDSLYNIIGAEFNGHYNSYEELNNTQKDLVELSKKKAYDNLKVVQYEDKNSSQENQVIVGDKGRNYLRGSCSMTHFPTLLDEGCYHDEVSVSCPTQESPRPHQRWVKIVSIVTTLYYWNKETKWTYFMREMLSTPLRQNIGMTDNNMPDN